MSYQRTKIKLRQQVVEMEEEMLSLWEKGISMELLAQKWGFKDRRSVWYHVNKARERRDNLKNNGK